MRMDKALLLTFGGFAAAFALIPDQKAPRAPAAAPAAAPIVEAKPESEPQSAPYVEASDYASQSAPAPRRADDDDSNVDMAGQAQITTGPSASVAARRTQSLSDEAAFQAQYRGN
jgi:hypothetical protein